jgi:hypothetical protein
MSMIMPRGEMAGFYRHFEKYVTKRQENCLQLA